MQIDSQIPLAPRVEPEDKPAFFHTLVIGRRCCNNRKWSMRTFAQKPQQKLVPSSLARPDMATLGPAFRELPTLRLQRTTGNQAVQRMSQADIEKLEAGLTANASHRLGHDLSQIPIHPPAAGAVQRKLAITKAGDEYEREADRISQEVMRMPEPQLQHSSACGGGLPKCQTEQPGQGHDRLQTKSVQTSDAAETSSAPSIVHDTLNLSGHPLDVKTRAFFEPRFGYDFGQVRIHTSGRASQSAKAIDAVAYTAGREIVFELGKYSPETTEVRRLLAHELTHTIQQGAQAKAPVLLQRDPKKPPDTAPKTPPKAPPKKDDSANLRNDLQALVGKKVTDYVTYRDAISKAPKSQKQSALADEKLISALKDVLTFTSFCRCVENLGRQSPTFDELKKDKMVYQAIEDAWTASDVGQHDLVTQAHEEGGWVFMNLINGSLHIERAKAEGTDFIRVEPPPGVPDSVLVAIFHTHPHLGPKAGPSGPDKKEDKRRGVPNLVAANTGKDPTKFQIYLSGPAVRKHLASDTTIPGPSGGIAP